MSSEYYIIFLLINEHVRFSTAAIATFIKPTAATLSFKIPNETMDESSWID
ncbi:MAG: hypothetical protein KME21_08445 [Desmonostoc vinosum HA7617-LM4]|nr:hypothetical protein [Desmonostoc vinosum HA7617-LM4]